MNNAHLSVARDLIDFIDASPSPYHCVASVRTRLDKAGFSALDEAEDWDLAPGGGAYVVRGDGSLIAFRLGTEAAADAGFRIVAAHTDSPNFRLKPHPAKTKEGYVVLDVEVYGGALLATWGDRDLGLAGRLLVAGDDGQLETHLVNIHEPVARISNLAIHLNRGVNKDGLTFDAHDHLPAAVALEVDGDPSERILRTLAEAADVTSDAIRGHDVCLYDVQGGTLAGLEQEFIHTARLDNQAMCHAGISALIEAGRAAPFTQVVALFDHEEVGSRTVGGADGPFLRDILQRIQSFAGRGAFARAAARSFVVSADMAHALHPNRSDVHDGVHQPRLNGGPAIKTNAKQRYATDATTGAIFRSLCRAVEVPVQEFAMRADMPCGSTVGPMTATELGIRTVDVGNPMLSMHSARETAGAMDPLYMNQVLTRLFTDPGRI